ncbi:MAG: hypothetical protein QOH66_2351, partial [Actinomycetota bacterium]|nr:hypothetical protein [Actinomycetota bacterium]
DLSRTVGWFTTLFPVVLEVPAGGEPRWRELIKSVRRQLRAVPGNGLGFGALQNLGPPPARERLLAGKPPQISFNYLGQWDARSQGEAASSLYRGFHGSIGQAGDPADVGGHPLQVVGEVGDGELGFSWYFRPESLAASTVTSAANDFADTLRRIARHAAGTA